MFNQVGCMMYTTATAYLSMLVVLQYFFLESW